MSERAQHFIDFDAEVLSLLEDKNEVSNHYLMVQISRLADKYFHDADLKALAGRVEAAEAKLAAAEKALEQIVDAVDYGRRHAHGMYAFTKLVEAANKADLIAQQALAELRGDHIPDVRKKV